MAGLAHLALGDISEGGNPIEDLRRDSGGIRPIFHSS